MLRSFLPSCFLAALLVTFATLAHAGPDCPINRAGQGCSFEGWGGQSTEASAQYDASALYDLVPWQAGQPCAIGCYDLRKGLLEAVGYASPWDRCGGQVFACDSFQVAGVASNSPLTFSAELWVAGTITDSASVRATLDHQAGPGYEGLISKDRTVNFKLITPFTAAPGEKFLVAFSLDASGYSFQGSVHSTAVLHFSGLPTGAYVVSCQNYDLPVPAKVATWGNVKAAYR